jgi:hypothetical protein
VAYNTLINLSPDIGVAESWFTKMVEDKVQPNEVTASSLAKLIPSLEQADRTIKVLLDAKCHVGLGFYSSLYSVIPKTVMATQLLDWHFLQQYRWDNALEAAISCYIRYEKLNDAFRIALGFPHLAASRKLVKNYYADAIDYLSCWLDDVDERHNALYALGLCHLENGEITVSVRRITSYVARLEPS